MVTNGEVPSWLDRRPERLRLVRHDMIFRNVGDLPTFNSNAIEMNLHRIPGLSRNVPLTWAIMLKMTEKENRIMDDVTGRNGTYAELETDDKGVLCAFLEKAADNEYAQITLRRRNGLYCVTISTTEEPDTSPI